MRRIRTSVACVITFALAFSVVATETTAKEDRAKKVAKWKGQKITLLGDVPLNCTPAGKGSSVMP